MESYWFKFKALDANGKNVSGIIEAQSEAMAYNLITARSLQPYQVKKTRNPTRKLFQSKKVRAKDLTRYIRQFSTFLDAGVPLLDTVQSLSKTAASIPLANASKNIRKDLRAGRSLAEGLQKHIPELPSYVPRLAELGEATGQLSKALSDASDRMEFEDEIRSEVRSALSYPTLLVTIGFIIILLLFLFVVPRFANLIGDNRESLPTLSRLVINTGVFVQTHWGFVLLFFVIIAALILGALNNQVLKKRVIILSEKIPVVGTLLIQSDLGNWSRTVGTALDNGSDLLMALRLGKQGLRSPRLDGSLDRVRQEVRQGTFLDDALEKNLPDMDPLTIDLIRTGRKSGQFAKMLLFVGKTQERQTRELAKRVSALAEPIAILAISLIVGTIVVSIVMAMTSLYDFSI